MLKSVETEVKKLGAFARASMAADLTEQGEDALKNGQWVEAFTYFNSALDLQPRREGPRKGIGELKRKIPSDLELSEDRPHPGTLEDIQKRVRKEAQSAVSSKDLAYKGKSLRGRAWDEKYPLSLVFAVFFLFVMTGGLLFETLRIISLEFQPTAAAAAALAVASLTGAYFLARRKLLGLIIAYLVMLVVFVGFWAGYAGRDPEVVRPMFFFCCLPSFLLFIVLPMNTGRIIKRHRAARSAANSETE